MTRVLLALVALACTLLALLVAADAFLAGRFDLMLLPALIILVATWALAWACEGEQ